MVKDIQPSFAGGELAPSLHARIDLNKYNSGLKTCLNCIVHAHGGVSNRPGTQFIAEVKDSSKKTRLIAFEFSSVQNYILEFGHQYMRAYKDSGQILEANKTITGATVANPVVVTSGSHGYSNGDEVFISGVVGMTQLNNRNFKVAGVTTNTFQLQDMTSTNLNGSAFTAYTSGGTCAKVFEIATPYDQNDLFRLKYTQTADVLTITHPTYAVRDLTRTGHTSWTLTEVAFTPEISHPTALACTANTTGSETARYTVTAFHEDRGEEGLAGVGAAINISGATQANPVVLTTATHGLETGDRVLVEGVVGMVDLNDRRFKITKISTTTFSLDGENGTGYAAYSSAGTIKPDFIKITNGAATKDNTVTWTTVSDADTYNIYFEKNGIYGFIGSSESPTFTDNNLDPDLDDTPPRARDPFAGTGNFPAATNYHEQRKVYAATNNKPQTIFMSQSANHNNFTFSSPRKADDAITRTINAREVNVVRHIVSLSDMLVLTSGGEWRLFAGSDDVITPTSINIKPQEFHGASHVRPLVVGNTVLYVQAMGSIVRDLAYRLETDGFTGTDLSILANHLFEGKSIVDWDYSEIPFSIVWAVRDDGVCLGLTYLREHEVWAWHRHTTTNGTFESVSSVSEGSEDAVYFVINRTIGGVTKRYVERLHTRVFTDVAYAFFVDSGLSLDVPIAITGATTANPVVITATAHGLSNGDTVDISDVVGMTDINANGWKVANKTTNTFELQDSNSTNVNGTAFTAYTSGGKVRATVTSVSGLWHLEGQTVKILANGFTAVDATVANGSVSVPDAASRIHVGLGYNADVETLAIELPTQTGTAQGKRKNITSLTMRVEKSRGIRAGPDSGSVVAVKDQLNTLFTGDLSMSMRPKWNTQGSIFVRQSYPLPMTILAIIPEVSIGG